MPKAKQTSPVYVYDWTYYPDDDMTHHDIVRHIRPLFKKWSFQFEKCPTTGSRHAQGRGSLFHRKRRGELIKMIKSLDSVISTMNVREASTNSTEKECFYTLKYDSRIEGPWDDRHYSAPQYIPRQYRIPAETYYPFQQTILDSAKDFDDRAIDVVISSTGRKGRSCVCHLGRLTKQYLLVPAFPDAKELCQFVQNKLSRTDNREPGIMFIDFPRALNQNKLWAYFNALEQIKSGYVVDLRYSTKEWDFDSPRLWVMMNQKPKEGYLSVDRWRYWEVNDQRELVPYSEDEPAEESSPVCPFAK